MQLKKPNVHMKIKATAFISLAIGDIILALFRLVVLARTFLELGLYVTTCTLSIACVTYYSYLIHFVYGVVGSVPWVHGLVVGSVPCIFGLVVGSVSWIFGLVIALPLCMDRVDYEHCINHQSVKSMIIVSVFLPELLALVVNFILTCLSQPVNEQLKFKPNSVQLRTQCRFLSQCCTSTANRGFA
ncbi:hypothetical protein Btru_056787 [Bulinus truncatus]|nr:hypothetical protein Btru_056787 [Bulinus truncatus]